MRIAVDALGGDHAPAAVVAGTLEAAAAYADTEFVLVGDEARVRPLCGRLPANLTLRHAPESIGMEEDPAKSIRRKKDSSLVVASQMVADGEAEAVFSAGNTGAMTAAATILIGRLEGVHRLGIATVLPTRSGWSIVCDVGASVDSRAEWIAQFGIMASLYAEEVEQIPAPRVGLLNIGEEECKGSQAVKEAHQLLAEAGVNWVGNVDGKDVFWGQADVIACDGFSGNLLLKVSEGAAEFFLELVRDAAMSSPVSRCGGLLIKPALRRMKAKIDYSEYGGAFLLGCRGLVVIGHGRSDAKAVRNALRRTRMGLERQLVPRLAARFAAAPRAAVGP